MGRRRGHEPGVIQEVNGGHCAWSKRERQGSLGKALWSTGRGSDFLLGWGEIHWKIIKPKSYLLGYCDIRIETGQGSKAFWEKTVVLTQRSLDGGLDSYSASVIISNSTTMITICCLSRTGLQNLLLSILPLPLPNSRIYPSCSDTN